MSRIFTYTISFNLFIFILSSFSVKNDYKSIKNWINENYIQLQSSVNTFNNSIEQNQPKIKVLENYKQLQYNFRKMQFLLEHISEESVKRYFNGPPLPSVEQSIPTVNVLEPRGLQVIDEILYSDTIDSQKLLSLSNELKTALINLKSTFTFADLYEADIKRAVYKDIIRIYTLQLTGFDTPGSLSGINNSYYNFKGIENLLNLSFPENLEAKQIAKLCKLSADYLVKNNDFDTFDRAFFYKNFLSRIFKLLSSWETNDLPLLSRNVNEKVSINYNSDHIFSTSLFNMDYYTQLPKNLISDKKVIELGKKLFYDPVLSSNNKMSCASCHNPEKAFSDGLQKTITNKEDLIGQRNTPTLINSILTKGYFYDLREEEASRQIVHVVKDKNEFNSDFIDIIDRLEKNSVYRKYFAETFPDVNISKYAITSAITAYIASLTSFDSPFDKYMRGETKSIDPKIIRGFNLFSGKAACATCHFIPTFSGLVPGSYKESESEVLGVPELWSLENHMKLDSDLGRGANGKPRDEAAHLFFSFKTTTIRNVEKTGPYMHNGSFKSLKEVMDFYNKGGGIGLGFNLDYQTLSSDSLGLTEREIDDIISFMESLTDIPLEY